MPPRRCIQHPLPSAASSTDNQLRSYVPLGPSRQDLDRLKEADRQFITSDNAKPDTAEEIARQKAFNELMYELTRGAYMNDDFSELLPTLLASLGTKW